MQIPILSGIKSDEAGDFRSCYPRNLIPVLKTQGVSEGYLRPADGLVENGQGPGVGRGGINWNGTLYRVLGSKLCRITSSGAAVVIGDVGSGGPVTMDYSFDRLAIASSNRLWYYDGASLVQVVDSDLGPVIDVRFIGGYFMTTDGSSLVVTELNDPTSVNPLKYGSSEADPDPVLAVDELRNEAYALNRYSIEVFQNLGGDNFPFQRVEGAMVPRGVCGTHSYCLFGETFAFVGSGRNESPSVFLMGPGQTVRISTREIDTLLQSYGESVLANCVVEARFDKGHQHLWIHMPDQVLVYDAAASAKLGEPVWFTLSTAVSGLGAYRARFLVWCYDRWNFSDPTSKAIGYLSNTISSHYGSLNGWEFGTLIVYNDGNGCILHSLELVGLPGRVALGDDPVIWTSYSLDGENWSMEHSLKTGKQGDRTKRLQWRGQGTMQHMRMQKFRGTSDCHMSFARLEAVPEPLNG